MIFFNASADRDRDHVRQGGVNSVVVARETSSAPRQALSQAIGRGVVRVMPWLLKALSAVGAVAMLLVGGGILLLGQVEPAHLR